MPGTASPFSFFLRQGKRKSDWQAAYAIWKMALGPAVERGYCAGRKRSPVKSRGVVQFSRFQSPAAGLSLQDDAGALKSRKKPLNDVGMMTAIIAAAAASHAIAALTRNELE